MDPASVPDITKEPHDSAAAGVAHPLSAEKEAVEPLSNPSEESSFGGSEGFADPLVSGQRSEVSQLEAFVMDIYQHSGELVREKVFPNSNLKKRTPGFHIMVGTSEMPAKCQHLTGIGCSRDPTPADHSQDFIISDSDDEDTNDDHECCSQSDRKMEEATSVSIRFNPHLLGTGKERFDEQLERSWLPPAPEEDGDLRFWPAAVADGAPLFKKLGTEIVHESGADSSGKRE